MIDFTPLELQVIHTVLRLTNEKSPEPLPESSREWANAMRSGIKKIEDFAKSGDYSMTTNNSKGMIEVDWGVSIEINSLTVQQPSGLQGGIFVEALYCHNGQKKWRIKSEAYFYGKDKTWIDFRNKEQFTDTYCWDDMIEAFLFAQKHSIDGKD